jgi:hypothetical protein
MVNDISSKDKGGYGRPPVHSRFQPGRSGNPKGRPKGTANLVNDLRAELSENISVREGAQDLKVSKQRAMLKTLIAKALNGDIRAANVVLNLASKLFEPEIASEPMPILSAEDQLVLRRFLARQAHAESSKPEGLDASKSDAIES